MSDFDQISGYVAVPRLTGLRLSPDGSRLVATISALTAGGKAFGSSLWEVDTGGRRPAERLTGPAKSVVSSAFLPDGGLVFVAKPSDPGATPAAAQPEPSTLWLLPSRGEATRAATRPGGFSSVLTADAAGTIVVTVDVLAGAGDEDEDAARRTSRKELDVRAILHERAPVRYWDHDLGPGEPRLAVVTPADDAVAADGSGSVRVLTAECARSLDEAAVAVSRDGRTVVTTWLEEDAPGLRLPRLVAVDTATGARRVIAEEPYVAFEQPAISPDGRWVVALRTVEGDYDNPPRRGLWLVDVTTGDGRALTNGADQWPSAPHFSADGGSVFYTSDENGRHPLFRVDVETAAITRVAAGGHYSDVCVAPDGRTLYALRDRVDAPPQPVRLAADGVDQTGEALPAPGGVDVPGRLEEIETTGADGHPLRGWLALPDAASPAAPAPLLLWVHGGPLGSWNAWSWRWNPWLMTARGYAVLMPDPALSTGYGDKMLRRGWGQWGGAPYDDLIAMTDAVVARPDVDESRTAAMGGSYGGYMANWIAGHTDRFRCIVTHASLWSLESFVGATDAPAFWVREWGVAATDPTRYEQWSPHRFADGIRTPMLVIHGDKDYRVPVGEGLGLWWDLQRLGVESKFLYFPDENHWVLKPGGARVWYETVLAWLDHHVLGEPWRRPDLV